MKSVSWAEGFRKIPILQFLVFGGINSYAVTGVT